MQILMSKGVSVDLNRVGNGLFMDFKRINIKNCLLLIFLLVIISILTIGEFGKNMTIYLFDHRSWVSSGLTIGIICLIIIKSFEIFKQKGMSAVITNDYKFLGPVGDLFLQGFSILAAAYSGFIVISLIILDRFPEEVPKEGLIFIFLLMIFLLGWCGFQIYTLIMETLIVIPQGFPAKEIKDIMDIMYCSELTSEEIQKLYKPKTKNPQWFNENCIGEKEIPECALNGHLGGTPFYTKDNKIMRSGKSTWDKLDIKPCLE